MPLHDHDQRHVEDFFRGIAPLKDAYQNNSFSYLAVRSGDAFVLVQGILFFHTGIPKIPFTHLQTESVRAGHYKLSELRLSPRELIDCLVSGAVATPHGPLSFPVPQGSGHSAYYTPFHQIGMQNQNRLSVLRLVGDRQNQYVRQPGVDWELRAASVPYHGLQDLMHEYGLVAPNTEQNTVDAVAYNVAAINYDSPISGSKATPVVHLTYGLDRTKLTLGYRVVSRDRTVIRTSIGGSAMNWMDGPDYQIGQMDIEIPPAALVQCIVSYDGIAQHYGWLRDPALTENPRRAVYEAFDRQLDVLKDILAKAQGRGESARDLEAAIAWLLWMYGFSVAHLGATRRTQDAADLIASTPGGHFAIIECTTGLLKAENKLALLHDRAQAARRSLDLSNNKHNRVLPVIVTSKTRAEVQVDIEQAERLGILVITREKFEEAFNQTAAVPDAEQFYREAEEAVRMAQARHEIQGDLPLPGPLH